MFVRPIIKHINRSKHNLFLLMLIFLFSTCKQEVIDPYENSDTGISAIVDGRGWVAREYVSNLYGKGIIIVGTSENKEIIRLILIDRAELTYPLDNADSAFAIYKKSKNDVYDYVSTNHEEAGGEITIIENNTLDSLISGTFSFVAYQSETNKLVKVRDGVFKDIPYQKHP